MAKSPAMQVCQLCAIDEFVDLEPVGNDQWQFRCAGGPQHPEDDHVWSPTPGVRPWRGRTSVGEELGVYEDLLACVLPSEVVEHGVVEHRFASLAPSTYRTLLERYGHRTLGQRSAHDYSASKFLAQALSQLAREGSLWRRAVRGTGHWHYLSEVSAWAQQQTPSETPTTTWVQFATTSGLDPSRWLATEGV